MSWKGFVVKKKIMNSILVNKSHLNAVAELGWQENKTTDYIVKHLKATPLKRGFGKGNTGLLYKIGNGSNTILLRADIDALKTANGIKHICGHSTHMASLMEGFHYTKTLEKTLNSQGKSIYFLFQPAEETFPSGGQAFVNECPEIVKEIKSAYAIHVRPSMKLGVIGLQPGPLWARGDYMEIEVRGKMVHIKNSINAADAIYASSLVVEGIKKIQQTYKSIRIGIGIISGGRQTNTVADYAILKGDIRIPNIRMKIIVKRKIKELITLTEQKTKTSIALHYFDGTPPVINNSNTTSQIVRYFRTHSDLPFELQTSELFSYGCEDFAYISERIPSTMALIGTGDIYDLHEENCTISDQGTINAYLYFKTLVDWFIQS